MCPPWVLCRINARSCFPWKFAVVISHLRVRVQIFLLCQVTESCRLNEPTDKRLKLEAKQRRFSAIICSLNSRGFLTTLYLFFFLWIMVYRDRLSYIQFSSFLQYGWVTTSLQCIFRLLLSCFSQFRPSTLLLNRVFPKLGHFLCKTCCIWPSQFLVYGIKIIDRSSL